MDIYKSMTVWELLNFLKSRVKQNVDQINSYVAELREFRKESFSTPETDVKISEVNKEISRLTSENNQFLTVFNDLLKLHNSVILQEDTIEKGDADGKQEVKLTDEFISECIDRTINGELPMDEMHPLLEDDESLETLFQKLMENELYEKCAVIKQLKEGRD
jgi:hypothetical protein